MALFYLKHKAVMSACSGWVSGYGDGRLQIVPDPLSRGSSSHSSPRLHKPAAGQYDSPVSCGLPCNLRSIINRELKANLHRDSGEEI